MLTDLSQEQSTIHTDAPIETDVHLKSECHSSALIMPDSGADINIAAPL